VLLSCLRSVSDPLTDSTSEDAAEIWRNAREVCHLHQDRVRHGGDYLRQGHIPQDLLQVPQLQENAATFVRCHDQR